MESKVWPVGDQGWAARYRLTIAGSDVPADALEEREAALVDGSERNPSGCDPRLIYVLSTTGNSFRSRHQSALQAPRL